MVLVAAFIWYLTHKEKSVYLLDFANFEPPEDWLINDEQTMQILRFQGCFTEESLAFQERMLKQSGVGPLTAWPLGTVRCLKGEKADTSAEAARQEAEVRMTTFQKCRKFIWFQ